MPSTTCAGPDKHRLIWPTTYTACPTCGATILPPSSKSSASSGGTGTPPLPPPAAATMGGGSASSSGSWSASVPAPIPPSSPTSTTAGAGKGSGGKGSSGGKGTPASAFGPLPSNVPQRPPDIEGSISLEPKRDTINLPLDWSDIVLRILFIPFMFPFLIRDLFRVGTTTKPTMSVYDIRVKTPIGATEEALIEGDLTGSRLSLGDNVSLWGKIRAGQFIVSQGYNHTTRKPITSRPSMRWFTRTAAIGLPSVVVLLLIIFAPAIPYVLASILNLIIFAFVLYFLIIFFVRWIPKSIVPYIVGLFILFAALTLCAHAGAVYPH